MLSSVCLLTELYEYCIKEGYADKNLIAKWKKQGYENLCCLRCIQTRDTNFGTNCICRVPKSKLEVVSLTENISDSHIRKSSPLWSKSCPFVPLCREGSLNAPTVAAEDVLAECSWAIFRWASGLTQPPSVHSLNPKATPSSLLQPSASEINN